MGEGLCYINGFIRFGYIESSCDSAYQYFDKVSVDTFHLTVMYHVKSTLEGQFRSVPDLLQNAGILTVGVVPF